MKQLKWSNQAERQTIQLTGGKAVCGWNGSFGIIVYVPSKRSRYSEYCKRISALKAELRATHPEIIEKLRSCC
jgi:hypothetical protein